MATKLRKSGIGRCVRRTVSVSRFLRIGVPALLRRNRQPCEFFTNSFPEPGRTCKSGNRHRPLGTVTNITFAKFGGHRRGGGCSARAAVAHFVVTKNTGFRSICPYGPIARCFFFESGVHDLNSTFMDGTSLACSVKSSVFTHAQASQPMILSNRA